MDASSNSFEHTAVTSLVTQPILTAFDHGQATTTMQSGRGTPRHVLTVIAEHRS
jgi:hypothetical protein